MIEMVLALLLGIPIMLLVFGGLIVGIKILSGGISDITYGDSEGFVDVILGLLITSLCGGVIVAVIYACFSPSEQNPVSHNLDNLEFLQISERLEANPFNKEAIHDAIIYNYKVKLSSELDDLGGENEYENYLNASLIPIDRYQMDFVEDNFDIDEIVEKIEARRSGG